MNPRPLFAREHIKFYEYSWVVLGAVAAAAVYDTEKPEHDIRWWLILLGSGWASICFFNIFKCLDEKWQSATRKYENALKVYLEDSFEGDAITKLNFWLAAGILSAGVGVSAGFFLV